MLSNLNISSVWFLIMKKNIAIVGGSSDIALSTITSLSSEDYDYVKNIDSLLY